MGDAINCAKRTSGVAISSMESHVSFEARSGKEDSGNRERTQGILPMAD